MTINWGAVLSWAMIALGALLLIGPRAAGVVLCAAGLLHLWGFYREVVK